MITEGAYGLQIIRKPPVMRLNELPAGIEWQPVTVNTAVHIEDAPASTTTVAFDGNSAAAYRFEGGGAALMWRDPPEATFVLPNAVDEEVVPHPLLAAAGAVFGYWEGREAYHAGAFAAGGGIWAVCGEKGAGKSTLLAYLSAQGVPVFADDLLVLDRLRALAAPRTVDLRLDAVDALGLRDVALPVRGRGRLPLDPVPPEAPLRGWLFLTWGDRVARTPIPAAERIRALGGQRTFVGGTPTVDPARILDVAALPMFRLQRPWDWMSLPAAAREALAIARG